MSLRKPAFALFAVMLSVSVFVPSLFSQLRFRPYEERAAWDKRSTYVKFIESEGIPIYKGYFANAKTVKLKPWKRLGVDGAYLYLDGNGDIADLWVSEIRPGNKSLPERHLFEEHIFVLSGEGETRVWQAKKNSSKTVGHWRKGSWFAIPVNAWHEHVNTGTTPVRMVAVTTAPVIMDIFHNRDFVFNTDYDFTDRFDGKPLYYDPENAQHYPRNRDKHALTITNMERDAYRAPLFFGAQGEGETNRSYILAGDAMGAHIEEMEPGTYQRAHRHGPAAVIVLLYGTGYSLLWPPSAGLQPFAQGNGEQVKRVDWDEGVVFVPPLQWYHQHFPSGKTSGRYLHMGGRMGNEHFPVAGGELSQSETYMVQYREEDPKILQIFEAELKKNAADLRMPPRAELIKMEEESARVFGGSWIHEGDLPKKDK